MARSSLSPGFRFHPTDVELVMYYLKRKLQGKKFLVEAIAEVNIYDFSPWDLPDKSNLRSRDLEWFFFCPKARKYSSGSRTNRATEIGYWKTTGKDRPVEYKQKTVALIKTLVFHLGHAPKGQRTDWVMHEYRMEDNDLANAGVAQDTYVLCRIFEKSGAGPKNGAQYGAPFNEEEWDDDDDDDVANCSEPSAVVGLFGATETPSYNQNGVAIVNMTMPQSICSRSLTEPGSSVVTSSVNERHIAVPVHDDDMLTNEDIASILGGFTKTFNGDKTTETLNCKQKANMIVPQNTCSCLLNELGASTVTSFANETHNDDAMLTDEDIASILGGFTNALNGNNNNEIEEVEILSEKETINAAAPNEDNGIYEDLVNLIDLQDLNDGEVNMFDGVDYTLDTSFMADDLDVNLGSFYVG